MVFLYSSSLCGFRDSLTFPNVGESEINFVENFIKTKLSSLVSIWKANRSENAPDLDDVDFFGPIHIYDKESFEFSPGDKLQILHIASYVSDKISSVGANYFNPGTKKNRNPSKNEYFGVQTAPKVISKTMMDESHDSDDLKSRLFKTVLKILNKNNVDPSKIGEFTDSMVSVFIYDDKRIEGHVHCVLCNKNREAIVVQTKTSDTTGKIYFISSNFSKHIKIVHSKISQCELKSDEHEFEIESRFDDSINDVIVSDNIKINNDEKTDDEDGIQNDTSVN